MILNTQVPVDGKYADIPESCVGRGICYRALNRDSCRTCPKTGVDVLQERRA